MEYQQMAGKQSLQDVAHKLKRTVVLSVGGQPPLVIAGYLWWRSLLEAWLFSISTLSLCIRDNPQQATCSQLKGPHVWSLRVCCLHLFVPHLLITVDALRPHRGQGPGASFNFDQLLFLHLQPHNNWPHCWPKMLHQRHCKCAHLTLKRL